MKELTIEEVLHKISVRIGVSIRAVRLSNALAAIDVDKPSDLQLARALDVLTGIIDRIGADPPE